MTLPKPKIISAVLVTASLIVVISAGFFYFRPKFFESGNEPASPKRGEPTVEINNHKFFVEIADEPGERSRGLGGRENLCDEGEKGEKIVTGVRGIMRVRGVMGVRSESCGMIFLFDQPGYYNFWMKDMKFPLDFIWIAGDKIIDIDENIPPDYSSVLKPNVPIDKVLEVNAGICEGYGIEIGEKVEFDLE